VKSMPGDIHATARPDAPREVDAAPHECLWRGQTRRVKSMPGDIDAYRPARRAA